ncbi:DUF2690 domain-containing protein [Streptomyces sp. NBC_00691]|uniref:DUF2690 domain-containing protein n=1 Tax=Streptomyces sp. NBC_00691 TaxID=2903671 RepID=UPI002E336FB2|nr:DUF2690 domain-containing protein [Streptomyces sp. NBC_00691]
MKPFARRLATATTAFALTASGLALSAGPASAATSCYAQSCQGLDPATTVCQNDARTVLWDGWLNVELRYSPSCRAAWARLGSGAAPTDLKIQNTMGVAFYAHYAGNGVSAWTKMVNDKDLKAWACGYKNNSDQFSCTSQY